MKTLISYVKKTLPAILAAILASFVSLSVFAQSTQFTGVTDSDVKGWAKNFSTIEKELDKAGVDSDLDFDDIAQLSVKKKNQVVQILNKNGISGNNSIEKFAMISISAAILTAESQLDEQSLAVMKAMGIDPIAALKANVNRLDFAVVQAHSKEVIATVNAQNDNGGNNNGMAYDDEDGNDSGDYGDYTLGNLNGKTLNGDYSGNDSLTGGAIGDGDMDEIDDGYSSIQDDFLKNMYQPFIDDVNNEAYPKYFHESLVKSKGDCGLLYKEMDSENASKYTKQKTGSQLLMLGDGSDIDDTEDLAYDDTLNAIGGVIDIKKKSAKIDFVWTEAVFDKGSQMYFKKNLIRKSEKYGIKSAEQYVFQDKKTDSIAREFVIFTKEGLVLHLWCRRSDDGNAYERKLSFNGINDTADLNWYVEKE